MKHIYIIIVFLFNLTCFSQTTATFETESVESTSFTDNGQVFNITTQTTAQTFAISNYAGKGWNGTATDNLFIDNSGFANYEPVQFTISSTGQKNFKLKSLYLFLSQTNLDSGTGNCTIVGKLNGVTQFTAVAAANFNSSTTNNGFTLINLADYSGSDNSNITIDQFVISTTGTFEYVALDAMNWEDVCGSLSLTAASQTNIACNGDSSGAASVNVATGGAGGYTYNWTPGTPTGDGTTSVTGLTAGTWTCTVTDANGCTKNHIFDITQPTVLTANPTQTNVSCFSGANGTATVTPTGGAGGYTYLWAHSGSTNASVTGLTAGTYSVKITDANACERDQSFTISEPAAIVLTPGTINNVSCYNGSNGTATVSAAGGAGSFTYSWSPAGGTAATASGLAAGTYTVTVTDANSCQATETFTIIQPAAALTVTGTSQDNITCAGTPSGSASVTVNGGTGAYTHLWTPTGGTAATATGLYSGTYIVYITDVNGCETSETFTITEPADPLTASSGTVANIACYGDTTGSAEVNVTGGDGNYTYSWSPSGGTGATANNLAAGTYTVTVTDGASCQTTQTFTITQPAEALSASSASSAVSCFGGSNGTASVTVSEGTFPYTYAWAPLGGTGSSISGRPAGDYTCTITDGNGCTLVKTVTISSPAAFSATTTKTDVSCNGGSNGTATVTPSGATAPYSYSWSPTGGTNASASGLSAGDYTVTVQDGNFCVYTVEITINEPDLLVLTPSQINVSCNGDSNGQASVTVTGGTAPYSYIWSPAGGTAATATGLTAGNYSVLVTDFKGCSTTQNFNITQPNALVASQGAITNLSCNGGTNGSATVNVTGGTGAYSYVWIPSGETSATASALTAGTNTVTVTDENNCTATQSFIITQPSAITFTTTILNKYDYDSPYSQIVAASGGTGIKTFTVTAGGLPQGLNLSSAGVISGKSTQVTDSNFTITATDASGCTIIKSFELKLSQIPITITANASQSKVYGENDPTFTYTVTPNLLSGDTFTGSLERVSGENVGNYQIVQGSLSAGDKYLIFYNSNSFSITAKPITVTATAKSKTYGEADPGLTYGSAPSLVTGDSFSGSLTRSPGENVGTYAINQGTLALNSNYTLTYISADLTIGAKTVTATAAAKSKTYGDADPALTYTSAPSLITGDSFSGSLSRTPGENVGSYAINQGTLALSSNYTLTYVGADLTIGAKTITVTAASKSKTYGEADPALTYTFAPALVGTDTFNGDLTRSPGENVGTYAINQGTLALSGNYTLTYITADLTIGAKTVTVTAAAKSKTYGDADPALTYDFAPALVTGDSFSGSLSRTPGENVGTYAINQGTLALNGNYTLTYVGADLTMGAKTITVTAAAKSKTYGDADSALTYTFAPALVGTDTFNGDLTRSPGENVGTYAINQGTLALSGNYTLTYVGADLTIGAKTITVTAAAKSKTYGDADPALTYTFAPALTGTDTFTGSLTRSPGENVGTYAINQGTLALNGNYTLTYVGADLTIGAKTITVTAAAKSKTYGDADPALTYTFAPALVGTDTFNGDLTRSPGENVGTYAINQGTLALSGNYTLTYITADLTIGAKTVTVTAAAKSKTYGDADPALTYDFAPALVTGDSFSGSLTRSPGENVGTYAINQGTLALNGNYTLTYVGADLTIGAKTVTVTAAAKSKTYGDADPALTYTFAPALVGTDTFNGDLTRSPGENVGTYAINQGTLALNGNYTLTYVGADLTIGTKTITVTAAAKSKTYGDVDPALTYDFAPALVTGDSFSGSLSRTPGENVGTYAINQGTLALNGNYTLTYVGADLTIGAKTITVTAAAKSKTYGDADPALTYTFAPALVTGDSFSGSLSRTPGENVGTYAINQVTLALNGNYTLTYVGADLTIGAKTVTVTAAAKSKTYGDADPALTYIFAPALVTGDSFSGSLSRTPSENMGTYAINQGTLALNGNYTLTYVGADLTIGAKTVTVTAAAKSKTYGDADPALTYTFAPALVGTDTFNGDLTRSPGENVGTYAINQGTLALNGNYTLTYVGADLTIGTKTITVTAAAKSKTYGDVDPALTYTFAQALVTGDSFSGSLSRTAGQNVGTYTINQGTLALSSNYTLTYVGNNFAITAKPITVTANASQSKVYGTADPVYTYSVSPALVSGDSFTGALGRVAGNDAGVYAITQGTLNAGTNYNLTYVGSNFTIVKANQTIIWNQTLGFGCEGETTVILTATSNSGLPVSYTSSNSNLVSISGNSLNLLNYGSVTISANQLGNNNYNPAVAVSLPLVNSQPNLIRKQFENIIFFDNSSKSFSTYIWYKNGVLVPGQTDQYFKENGPLNGTYYALATKLDGIAVTTCPLVLSPTIEEEYIKIVPNPVKPNASYELLNNVPTARLQNARIEVYSVGGLLLENKTTSQNTVTLKAPTVEGIYIIKMTLANGKYFTKNLLVKN